MKVVGVFDIARTKHHAVRSIGEHVHDSFAAALEQEGTASRSLQHSAHLARVQLGHHIVSMLHHAGLVEVTPITNVQPGERSVGVGLGPAATKAIVTPKLWWIVEGTVRKLRCHCFVRGAADRRDALVELDEDVH